MKDSGMCVLTLVGGMLLGAAVTALLTPKSGKELRGSIRGLIHDEIARLHQCHCGEAGCHCDTETPQPQQE